jgi:hypothetical protein
MRQGLSSINETNEFYNDLVRTASAHIGNATQQANNAYPEDVKAAEKKYTNYVSLVETLGKDKADFIFENTNYLDQDNFMSLSKNVIFKPDFKYYARVEPVETITKNANANITNVKNQINNSSSLRGMGKVSQLYLPMLPQEATFDTSRLPVSDSGSMTEADRMTQVQGVVLPTEVRDTNTMNMAHMAVLSKFDGDINAASEAYGIPVETLANAKSATSEFSSTDRAALSLVNTDKYIYALQYGTPETQALELVKLQQQINTMKTVVQAVQGVDVSVEDQTASIMNAVTDGTMFNIGGKERSFADIMKVYRRDNKDITKEQVIRDLLDSNNFNPITS